MLKKILAGIITAAALTACIPAAEITCKKEPTINDYNHKSHDYTYCTWNTKASIDCYYCIVTELDYNIEHGYYTAYADSDFESWICIADDITRETAFNMYLPGTKIAVLYLNGNINNVIDLKVVEKPE